MVGRPMSSASLLSSVESRSMKESDEDGLAGAFRGGICLAEEGAVGLVGRLDGLNFGSAYLLSATTAALSGAFTAPLSLFFELPKEKP